MLEVGKKYQVSSGEIVTVIEITDMYVFTKQNSKAYGQINVRPVLIYDKKDIEALQVIGGFQEYKEDDCDC